MTISERTEDERFRAHKSNRGKYMRNVEKIVTPYMGDGGGGGGVAGGAGRSNEQFCINLQTLCLANQMKRKKKSEMYSYKIVGPTHSHLLSRSADTHTHTQKTREYFII